MDSHRALMRRIIISLAVVLVAAGGVIGGLYWWDILNPSVKTPPAVTEEVQNDGINFVVDDSVDYGACKLLNRDVIQAAFGEAARLEDAANLGRLQTAPKPGSDNVALTVDTQECVFAFVPGGTTKNGFNYANGLSVGVNVYPTRNDAQIDLMVVRRISQIVSTDDFPRESVFYRVAPASDTTTSTSFILTVFKDLKKYTFAIRQPADKTTFTQDSAKTVLIKLASEAFK